MSAKPIRIFYSTLTGRFYASSRYRLECVGEDGVGSFVITGEKFDVTDQIGQLVHQHDIEFVPRDKPANPLAGGDHA